MIHFRIYPRFEKRGNHVRHIQASKRTIALGVFAATADLVNELGELDQNLYETDRIEVGRRLDCSRWLNFVELSSSTRWKDIESETCELLEHLPQQKSEIIAGAQEILASLRGSDRIKDDVADQLLYFLDQIDKNVKKDSLYDETLEQIKRATHFQTARELVFKRLPLLIYFNHYGNISAQDFDVSPNRHDDHPELTQFMEEMQLEVLPPTSNNVLDRIETGINLAISASSSLSRMKPIFLFDAPEKRVTSSNHKRLQQLIGSTAKTYQCCYLSHEKDFFPPTETGRNHSDKDLQTTTNTGRQANKPE